LLQGVPEPLNVADTVQWAIPGLSRIEAST
jgi:hypothetical protein